LHQLFSPWRNAVDESYVSYVLTIDEDDLPTRFALTWKVPVAGVGFYESTFTTRYRQWRQGQVIVAPK
jgi:hypothetical protein